MCGMSSVSEAWPRWVTNGLELFNWVCVSMDSLGVSRCGMVSVGVAWP